MRYAGQFTMHLSRTCLCMYLATAVGAERGRARCLGLNCSWGSCSRAHLAMLVPTWPLDGRTSIILRGHAAPMVDQRTCDLVWPCLNSVRWIPLHGEDWLRFTVASYQLPYSSEIFLTSSLHIDNPQLISPPEKLCCALLCCLCRED